jgi:hypothetical protein
LFQEEWNILFVCLFVLFCFLWYHLSSIRKSNTSSSGTYIKSMILDKFGPLALTDSETDKSTYILFLCWLSLFSNQKNSLHHFNSNQNSEIVKDSKHYCTYVDSYWWMNLVIETLHPPIWNSSSHD